MAIEEGLFYTIVGKNGVGKSTLAKILAGLQTFSSGEIFFSKKNLKTYSEKVLSQKISYMEQYLLPPEDLTIRGFMALYRYPYKTWSYELNDKESQELNNLLNGLDLYDKKDQNVITLSGGEWQKVCLLGSLFQAPSLLILDEPFSGLDPHIQDEMYKFLRDYSLYKNITILMISHDLNRSALFSDFMLGMKDGVIVEQKRSERFMKNDILKNVYDSEFLLEKHSEENIMMTLPRTLK